MPVAMTNPGFLICIGFAVVISTIAGSIYYRMILKVNRCVSRPERFSYLFWHPAKYAKLEEAQEKRPNMDGHRTSVSERSIQSGFGSTSKVFSKSVENHSSTFLRMLLAVRVQSMVDLLGQLWALQPKKFACRS